MLLHHRRFTGLCPRASPCLTLLCRNGSDGLVGHRRAKLLSALLCRPPLVPTCTSPEVLRGRRAMRWASDVPRGRQSSDQRCLATTAVLVLRCVGGGHFLSGRLKGTGRGSQTIRCTTLNGGGGAARTRRRCGQGSTADAVTPALQKRKAMRGKVREHQQNQSSIDESPFFPQLRRSRSYFQSRSCSCDAHPRSQVYSRGRGFPMEIARLLGTGRTCGTCPMPRARGGAAGPGRCMRAPPPPDPRQEQPPPPRPPAGPPPPTTPPPKF